jgi:hypothetical protein
MADPRMGAIMLSQIPKRFLTAAVPKSDMEGEFISKHPVGVVPE